MSKAVATIREWLPAVLSVAAVLSAACYAVTKQSRAAEGIHEMGNLGAALTQVARQAESGMVSRDGITALEIEQKNIAQRLADAKEPSLVQAELMKSAARTGLTLRELNPLLSQSRGLPMQDEGPSYPRYRIQVTGTYQQIAEFMEECTQQHLPTRVQAFELRPSVNKDGKNTGRLAADITVEAFRPADEPSKDKNGI